MIAARRAQAIAHAHGEVTLAPQLEQRLVVLYLDVVPARITDACDTHGVECAKKSARAIDLLREVRDRQQVKEIADGAVVTGEPSGWLALVIALNA